MSMPKSLPLGNGSAIPSIGLGTWAAPKGEVESAVATALLEGYRHIDCALIYKNEIEVAEGIRRSGVLRKDIFITSKLWNAFHSNVAESLRRSLENLGVDYLDLYVGVSAIFSSTWLTDWPVRLILNESSELLPINPDGTRAVDHDWDVRRTWAQMEDILDSGKVKAIGVCNWSVPYLEELKKVWRHKPSVNQVELHPYLPQLDLVNWCKKEDILVVAYSPLGGPGAPLLEDTDVFAVSEKRQAHSANVLISYHIKRGIVPLVKSVSPKRLKANLQVIDLDADDIKKLDEVHNQPGKHVRYQTPLWRSNLGFGDWYGYEADKLEPNIQHIQ
ncbi:unnamed protein product [Clonostachys rosea f. rosea IK726]|uniref:NADP-dependent oxidoreductase domain-containing protein n=2 Tax=Bionectria ochroleuca TaxID=29856 RepID=A0A0B7KIR9_BIOOC|nr:unnamed protein product [Clonostachys rosea f. rosea IK726]